MAKLAATDYAGLDRYLGRRSARTIGNNTTAERDGDGFVIRLHGHAIVRLMDDRSVSFTLAGWNTVTTRERVNQFLPMRFHVVQRNFEAFTQDQRSGEIVLTPIFTTDWYSA